MPCDTRLRWNRKASRRQTIKERVAEVEVVAQKVQAGLLSGAIKVVVGKQGAVAFNGLTEEDRADVTDACIFRRIIAKGSAQARMALQRAEVLAGRAVSRQVVAQGTHSHDGGVTWHDHKG